MIFDPQLPDYKNRSLHYINHLIEKKKRFELREIRYKSKRQKGYLYFAFKQVMLDTGCDLEEVKQYLFKQVCNRELFLNSGKFGVYLRSSEDLDTKEMTTAIENFRAYCSRELGIYIPDPNEEQEIAAWEAELSKYE